MRIFSIEWKNFNSYGNSLQRVEFGNTGNLYSLLGSNGAGKCLTPETEIEVEIEDEKTKLEFLNFLSEKYKNPLLSPNL